MSFEQKLLELHRNARRIAFHYAIRKGSVPPNLAEIVEATRAPHLFFAKYRVGQLGKLACNLHDNT